MSSEFWITTVAIISGPILAVVIAQWMQIRFSRRERKLYVLRALMSTRRTQLSQERVAALNLIDIEFANAPNVISVFRKLLEIYGDVSRWKSEDQGVVRKLFQDVDDVSVSLVQEIAKDLGYKFDQLEILRGGYYPEAFVAAEEQQKIIREFLVGLREGRLMLPVGVVNYVDMPPPQQKSD